MPLVPPRFDPYGCEPYHPPATGSTNQLKEPPHIIAAGIASGDL
jgi:hypothetical protein